MNMHASARYLATFGVLAYLPFAAGVAAQAQHSPLLPEPVKVQYGGQLPETDKLVRRRLDSRRAGGCICAEDADRGFARRAGCLPGAPKAIGAD